MGPRVRGAQGLLRERPHRLPHGARAARARPRLRRGRRLQDAEAGGGRAPQERPARRRVHRPHARHPQHRGGPAARCGRRGRPGPRPRPRRRHGGVPPRQAAPQHVPDQAGPRLGRAQRRRDEEGILDARPLEVDIRDQARGAPARRARVLRHGREVRGVGPPAAREEGARPRPDRPVAPGRRGALLHQGNRHPDGLQARSRGGLLHEVPDGPGLRELVRAGPVGALERRDRAARRDVSVNLFFTSFAKQARRLRKGGFTGCANVFSPIPVTARRGRPSAGPSACRTCRLS